MCKLERAKRDNSLPKASSQLPVASLTNRLSRQDKNQPLPPQKSGCKRSKMISPINLSPLLKGLAFLTFLLFSRCGSIQSQSVYSESDGSSNAQAVRQKQFSEIQLIANGTSINGNTNQAQPDSMPTIYSSLQAQRFRVNVSNICEKNHMRVTVRLSRPFYGIIHTKDKRKKHPCFVDGNGEQTYNLEISYTQVQSEPNYCGVVSHNLAPKAHGLFNQTNQQTLSVALVVRLHKTIEFSDDRYFLLSCAK